MARIIVTGYMIRHPLAGNMLAYFHYVLGFHRLGHEVCYLEESGWRNACYNPESGSYSDDPSYGIHAVRALLESHDISVPVGYVNRNTGAVSGNCDSDLERLLSSADLLLNIGGVCSLPQFALSPRRALIDMDPLFTQLGFFAGEDLHDYDVHFSYGSNIGRPGSSVPTCGIDWLPVAPPVVPAIWQESARSTGMHSPDAPFTTVCNWSAYGAVEHEGERYGQKDVEFLRLLELPGHVSRRLALAVSGADAGTRQMFEAAGWSVCNAADISSDVSGYQRYIAGSRGEFSAAKQAYVKTRSGWFSDRSVCYLAAGRPVIVQDTGIGDWLTTGQGVLTFSSMDQAIDRIEQVEADYAAHCEAAIQVADQVFSYKVVLPRLLEQSFASRHAGEAANTGLAKAINSPEQDL
ncbi:MAG: hypothetical protein U9P11_00485 [Pseudomonadota bacterium]|nr:hypothetical protein [Pseudomonadota bacterium]